MKNSILLKLNVVLLLLFSTLFSQIVDQKIQNLLDSLSQDSVWQLYSLSRFPYLKAKHHFWQRGFYQNCYEEFYVKNKTVKIWQENQNSIILGFKTVDKETNLDIYQAGRMLYNNNKWVYQPVLFMIGRGFNCLKAFENGIEVPQ